MPLSREIIHQIMKEAMEYSAGWGVNNDAEAYQVGAEKWAVWKEKAEGYEKALAKLVTVNDPISMRNIATKALESFNQNKVKL